MVFQGEFSITREKYKLYYVYIKGWFQRKRFQFTVFKYFSRISLLMQCLQQGRIHDFFRRGCTRLLSSTSTPRNHIFFFCRIPVVLENRRSSKGGERTPCTLPLDPPLYNYSLLEIRLFCELNIS